MAVYQGARRAAPAIPLPGRFRRPVDPTPAASAAVAIPAPAVGVPALPRRRARTAVRARRGTSRVGILLSGIVVAFAAAFFSLAQDVRVSAVGYEIDRLQLERERLEAREQELSSELNRLGKAPAVRKFAIDAGLAPLREPLLIPAR